MANTTWSFIWVTLWGAIVSILANRFDRWFTARKALILFADFGGYFDRTRTAYGESSSLSQTTALLVVTASNRGKENITISRADAKLDDHTKDMILDPEDHSGQSTRGPATQYTLEPGGKRGRWSCPITYAEATRLQSIILIDGTERIWRVHHTTITRLKANARVALKNQKKSNPPNT